MCSDIGFKKTFKVERRHTDRLTTSRTHRKTPVRLGHIYTYNELQKGIIVYRETVCIKNLLMNSINDHCIITDCCVLFRKGHLNYSCLQAKWGGRIQEKEKGNRNLERASNWSCLVTT